MLRVRLALTGPAGATGNNGAAGPTGPQGSSDCWLHWASGRCWFEWLNGSNGATGATGATGSGFNFRGPWAAVTNYNVDDVVTDGGQTWLIVNNFTSGSFFDSGNMVLLAAAGATGTTGANGSTGATGATGKPAATVQPARRAFWSEWCNRGARCY